jgi:hypothetical protein
LTTYMSMNRAWSSSKATPDMTNDLPAPLTRCGTVLLIRHPKVTNRRCSRPLCSSQRTVGTPDHRAKPDASEVRGNRSRLPAGADPSGPNSVHVTLPPARPFLTEVVLRQRRHPGDTLPTFHP